MPDPSTITGLAFILVGGSLLLGILVFIHEAGHYFVAKALGIRVEVFSLGFGPRVTGFVRGATEYRLSAIPLGGYVKMLGENPEEGLKGNREEFLSRTKFERFLVLVMGATMNIVLAIVLSASVYMYGVKSPLYVTRPAVIGWIAPDAAAAEAGLAIRDEILSVDGKDVHTWREMHIQVALNPNKTIDFKLRRDGEVRVVPVTVRASAADSIGMIGVLPLSHYALSRVTPGGSGATAGLRAGDEIVSVNGQELFLDGEGKAFTDLVASSAGKTLAFRVNRDTETIDIPVVPVEKDGKGELGINLGVPEGLVQFPPMAAVSRSLHDNWEQAGLLMISLKKLVTREMSPKTLSGPISIFRMAGASLQTGLAAFLSIMGWMSLQLGIINLLPIPLLDGGHIFIIVIEGVIRRDLSMKIKERVMQFGFILLLLIMGGVISMDVYKNFLVK